MSGWWRRNCAHLQSISNVSSRNQRLLPALQTYCTHPHSKCTDTPEDQRQNSIPASAMDNSTQKHNALLHTLFPQGKKKGGGKKSSGFNPWLLCQIYSYPDGSAGEVNDKVQNLSQEQLPAATLEATTPPLFGDNHTSSSLCPPPTPAASPRPKTFGAILDREGKQRSEKHNQARVTAGGRVKSGHSQRTMFLEPLELVCNLYQLQQWNTTTLLASLVFRVLFSIVLY